MDLIHHLLCRAWTSTRRPSSPASAASGPTARSTRQVRTFGTMTADLLALADWLAAEGVSHVAMESTGVYWKPVFHLLEGRFEVLLVNAQHIKQVPGRKTDVKDAEWIAQLLQHGLLRPSFIPPPPIRELRDLTRQRTQLVRERATVVNRIQKVLEDANIKLASVATDVLGASGRAMLAGADRRARRTRPSWPSWPRGGCGARSPSCRQALRGPGHRPPPVPAADAAGPGRAAGGADRASRRRGSRR